MRCAVVIECAGSTWPAYVVDVPGCIATGATRQEAELRLREAIAFHIEGLREDGLSPPATTSHVACVDIAA